MAFKVKENSLVISKETGVVRMFIEYDEAYVTLQTLDPRDHYIMGYRMGFPAYKFEEEFRPVTSLELKMNNFFECECGSWIDGALPKTPQHSRWCKLYE